MERSATCAAIRRDGERCASVVVLTDGYCHMHSPERTAAVQAARVKGGRHSSNAHRARKLMAADVRPIFDLIVEAMRRTYAGELDPRVLTALAAGVSAACRAYEVGVIEDRLNAVGERLEQRNAG